MQEHQILKSEANILLIKRKGRKNTASIRVQDIVLAKNAGKRAIVRVSIKNRR